MLTINNPVYTLRLIDLIDTHGKLFEYSHIYDTVGIWLEDLQSLYYDTNQWSNFIELLCDNFYNRNLSFDTYFEFKLKLKCVLNKYKDRAERMNKLFLENENIFEDYKRFYKKNDSGHSENIQNGVTESRLNENQSTNTNGYSNSDLNINLESVTENKDYTLYSDTPSNTVNLTDMTSKDSNYVTNVTNNGSESTDRNSQSQKSHNDFNNNDSGNRNSENISTNDINTTNNFKNVSEDETTETRGSTLEFFERLKEIQTNINQMYIEWIEEEHLFMKVIY